MKNLVNAMNTFGDGEEEGSFNPEDFFSFGNTKPATDNPFSQDNLKKVEESIKTETSDGAQMISETAMSDIDLSPYTDTPTTGGVNFSEKLKEFKESQEEKLPERTISTNNRFNSFEETSEVEEPTTIISIDSDEDLDIYIEPTPLTVEDKPEVIEPPKEVHSFEELEKVAVKQDSEEVARMLDSKSVDKTIVEDEIVFNIDDDEEEEVILSSHMDEVDYRTDNFYTEPNDETTYTQPTNENNYNQEPPNKNYTQENNTQQYQPSGTISDFQMYSTRKGDKFRPDTELKDNEFMINISKFNEGSEIIGDAYIESAKIIPYGDSKKRAEYRLLISGGIKVSATQFTIPNYMSNTDINKLVGNSYKVEGKWNLYKKKKQLVVNTLTDTSDTTPSDFVGTGDEIKVFEDIYEKLVSKIKRPWVRELVDSIMIGDDFLQKTKRTPAGLSNHDTGKDGLFRHKVKVTLASYQISLMYPTVDLDVLIASGLLHDIGKVFEMGDSTYTDIGITSGHITIGYAQVRERLNQMSTRGVPVEEKVALNILHCILSHHGKLEYGSPTTPKTREAWIIHLCDMIDTNVTHIDETLTGNKSREYSTMLKHDVLDLNIF